MTDTGRTRLLANLSERIHVLLHDGQTVHTAWDRCDLRFKAEQIVGWVADLLAGSGGGWQDVPYVADDDERHFLWLNHGCSVIALYGDDGEMQCANGHPHHLVLDFKRQPLPDLRQAVVRALLSRLKALAGSAPGDAPQQEEQNDEHDTRVVRP